MPKKIKKNWLAVVGTLSISLSAIAGTCTSLYFGYKNYEQGPDFDKSYNLKYELNVNGSENPWEQNEPLSIDDAAANAKATADSFSKYLNFRDRNDYSVYSEAFEDPSTNKFRSFLNVVVPNEKVASKIDKDKKVDKTVGEIYYEYNSNPQISIIYSDDIGSYYDFSQEFLAGQTSNNIKISDNGQQINIKMDEKHNYQTLVDKFTPVKKDTANDTVYEPFMYVFRNQTGLLNRMAYIMSLKTTDTAYGALSESEQKFYEDTQSGVSATDLNIRNSDEAFDGTKSTTKTLVSGGMLVPNNDNGRSFVEEVTYDGGVVKHTAKSKYDFINNYLIGIIKIEDFDEKKVKLDSFEHFFPEKNPTDAKKDSDHKWFCISEKSSGSPLSKFEADLFYRGITKDKLTYPMLVRTVDQIQLEVNEQKNIFVVNPTFNGNIFGQSSIIWVLISIAIIVLILGIVVSVFYRIPGLIAFLLVLLSMSLAFLIICTSGFLISSALIYGLFIGFVVGLFTILGGFERVKRELSVGYTTMISVKNGFLKSFLPVFDICLVSLLCGVGFVYIGPNQFLSLGVLLILMGIMTMVIVYGGQFLSLFTMYYQARIGKEKNYLFVSKRITKNVKTKPFTSFDTTFMQRKLKTPFNIFNKKLSIVLGVILVALITAGLVVMYTIGDMNSFVFSGGTRIMVSNDFLLANSWDISMFMSMIGNKWTNGGLNGSYWILTSPTVLSFSELAALVPGVVAGGSNVFVQEAIPNSFTILTNNTIKMLFATTGILTAYSLVRFNWLSIIPTFLALILVPGIVVTLFVACQIYIDQTIIIAIGIVYAINALIVFNLLGNINNSSVKKEKGDIKLLTEIYNIEVWGSKIIFSIVGLFIVCSLVIIGVLISSTILSLMSVLLAGIVLSILTCFFFTPQILILFKSLNNKYSRKVTRLESRQESYDVVDEQLIDGINYEKSKA